MSVEQIATAINRTEGPVKKYITENNLTGNVETFDDERERMLGILYSKPYWKSAKKQFVEDELEYYREEWLRIMAQFQEDVLYTEERNIHELCRIRILQDRAMIEKKEYLEEIARLQDMIAEEQAKDLDEQNRAEMVNYEGQIAMAKSAATNYTKEFNDLLDKTEKIEKSLKATRSERIKRVEDGKENWTGYLKLLEDEEFRAKESRSAELQRISKDKVKMELGKLHQYEDDAFDRPFLTPETVAYYNEHPEEENK